MNASQYTLHWIPLWNERDRFSKNVSIIADITSYHILDGDAVIAETGYARLHTMRMLPDTPAIKKRTAGSAAASLQQYTLTTEANMAVQHKLHFAIPATATGNYHAFSLNLFSGTEENPFLGDTRQTDIFFGYNQSCTINSSVLLPEGYTMEEISKNIRMVMPDTSIVFSRYCFFSEGVLTVRVTLDFNSPVYAAENYSGFKAFIKKN